MCKDITVALFIPKEIKEKRKKLPYKKTGKTRTGKILPEKHAM